MLIIIYFLLTWKYIKNIYAYFLKSCLFSDVISLGIESSSSDEDFLQDYASMDPNLVAGEVLEPWCSPSHSSSSSSSHSSSTTDDKMDIFDHVQQDLQLAGDDYNDLSEFLSSAINADHSMAADSDSTSIASLVASVANSLDGLPSPTPHTTGGSTISLTGNFSSNNVPTTIPVNLNNSNNILNKSPPIDCSEVFIKTEDCVPDFPWHNIDPESTPKFTIVKTEPISSSSGSVISIVTTTGRTTSHSTLSKNSPGRNTNKLILTTSFNNVNNGNNISPNNILNRSKKSLITNGCNPTSNNSFLTTIKTSPPTSPPYHHTAAACGIAPRYKVLSITSNKHSTSSGNNSNKSSLITTLNTRTITKTKKIQPKMSLQGLATQASSILGLKAESTSPSSHYSSPSPPSFYSSTSPPSFYSSTSPSSLHTGTSPPILYSSMKSIVKSSTPLLPAASPAPLNRISRFFINTFKLHCQQSV